MRNRAARNLCPAWRIHSEGAGIKGAIMLAFAIFLAAAAVAILEARRSAYEDRAEWRREVRVSIALGAAALAIEIMLPDAGGVSWSGGAALALAVFIADDFLYYLSHRLAHRVSVFWASHAVHHSPRCYNFLTGLRQPPTWILTPAALAQLALLAAGAPAGLVAASAALRGVHHFVIHTERVRRLPAWIEFIFNTPSHHRVHHAIEPGCIDRNFGGVLIIWDRLFGTFAGEPDSGATHYGLVHPTRAGALYVMLDPWRTLARRLEATPVLKEKLRIALGPP